MPKRITRSTAPSVVSREIRATIRKADKAKAPPARVVGVCARVNNKLSKVFKRKDVVAPKRNAPTKGSKANNEKTLDLCLVLDCTGSMYSWIQRSKDTLKDIIDHVKADNPTLRVRVSFVGYRDFGDGA